MRRNWHNSAKGRGKGGEEPTCTAPHHACRVVPMPGKTTKYRKTGLQLAQTWLHLSGRQGVARWAATSLHSSLSLGRSPLWQGQESCQATGTALHSPKPAIVYLMERHCHPLRSPWRFLAYTVPEYKQTWPLGLKGRERPVFSCFFQHCWNHPKEIHQCLHSSCHLSTCS